MYVNRLVIELNEIVPRNTVMHELSTKTGAMIGAETFPRTYAWFFGHWI